MKSKIAVAFIAMLIATTGKAQPPNNPIFFGSTGDGISAVKNGSLPNSIFVGGDGDGFAKASNGVNANDIFKGGNGDGFHVSSNNAAANIIFVGGDGDGFNVATNNAASNIIFLGGDGDGWNKAGNGAPSNNIFIGGDGDGWSYALRGAPSNNIFLGGEGDGWSSVYLPTGPLPVTYQYFTAAKLNETAAILRWETSQEINSSHFEVERSLDAISFAGIGRIAAAGNASNPTLYSFTDYNPQMGVNYYRLKQVDRDGNFTYSPARAVRFDMVENGMVKYYPNPTHGMLNVAMTGNMKMEAKVINISNAAGIVVRQIRLAANGPDLFQVNMNGYAKGVYFIQVKSQSTNSTSRIVLQ